ncbi:MAG: DUF4175 family protein [Flavobacteriaceae bacterium]
MNDFQVIEQKLIEFKRKYYLNALIRGSILFVALGAMYFLCVAWLEQWLWMPSAVRQVVFWLFICVELGLLVYWVGPSLSVLLGLRKPMSHRAAAEIIGTQLPEVGDQLVNTLDLRRQNQSTELILASIEQKSKAMTPFYFTNAVNLKENKRYLRWLLIPGLAVFGLVLFGELQEVLWAYGRVATYNTQYQRPAPYRLTLVNERLRSRSNEEILLVVKSQGDVVPAEVSMLMEGQRITMTPTAAGEFKLMLPPQADSFSFSLATEFLTTQEYRYEIINGPEIKGFSIDVVPPAYTGMPRLSLENNGNIRALKGSKITWKLSTEYTDEMAWVSGGDSLRFNQETPKLFSLTQKLYGSKKYSLSAGNTQTGMEPGANYIAEVFMDRPPQIEVETSKDSVYGVSHHKITAWDDFSISTLRAVCYPVTNPTDTRELNLAIQPSSRAQAIYSFPRGFDLIPGEAYQYYFEAMDNDQVSGPKSVRSPVYGHKELLIQQAQNQLLSQQNNQTKQLEEALSNLTKQGEEAREFDEALRQKEGMKWKDERALEQLIKQKEAQLEVLEQQTQTLQKTLEQYQQNDPEPNTQAQQLMERIEEQIESLQEQSQQWKELQELQEQLEQEDLLDELQSGDQQQKAQEQNLSRLVELTRRFFITEKLKQIGDALEDLGQRQEATSELETESQEEEDQRLAQQKQMNQEFEAIRQQLDAVEQENSKLQDPMTLPRDEGGEMDVSQQQQKATDAMEQGEQAKAKASQKDAGKKMQELAKKMNQQMQNMQMESMQEDSQMLRQILDNLIVFSLQQEGLMLQGQKRQLGGWSAPDYINRQNDLKMNFNHVDDSLYALSMRQPMISGQVNQALSKATYYLDKTLEELAESSYSSAASGQQFVFTQANDLANLLDGVVMQMEQMAMSMPGAGTGKSAGSQGFQLQDIIQQQQSLQEQGSSGASGAQQKGGKPDQQGQEPQKPGNQDNGKQGQSNTPGSPGESSGQQGQTGQNSESSYGDSESEKAARYALYKQQQKLRQALEDRLKKEGLFEDNRGVLDKMQENAEELLKNGLNKRSRSLMRDINYQLIKLEEAEYQQGKQEQRESQANRRKFPTSAENPWRNERSFFDQLDILIKDALPLQPYFKKQAERYFKLRDKSNDQF